MFKSLSHGWVKISAARRNIGHVFYLPYPDASTKKMREKEKEEVYGLPLIVLHRTIPTEHPGRKGAVFYTSYWI